MDTTSTLPENVERKEMPAEVFVQIWKGEMDVEGTEWEKHALFIKNVKNLRKNIGPKLLENVKLEDHYFGDVAVFRNIKITKEIHIHNAEKQLPCLILEYCELESICLENSRVHSFYVSHSVVTDGVKFLQHSDMGYFYVQNSKLGLLKLKNTKATVLRIEHKSIINKLHIWHSVLQRLRITEGTFIEHVFCQFSFREASHIIVDKCNISFLDFDNTVFPALSTINFSNCKINNISLRSFCNFGSIFFGDLKPLVNLELSRLLKEPESNTSSRPPTKLSFVDSDLGKTQFVSSNLSEFEQFEFYNTKILNVFAAGSIMPSGKHFVIKGDNLQKENELLEQKRIAFSQFKKIYEAQGDHANAVRYHSYEMEAYRKQLQKEGVVKHFWEIIMLWLNKISTNHGSSWSRGLLSTLTVLFIFFSWLLWEMNYPVVNILNAGDLKRAIVLYIYYAPNLINPLQDLDSLKFVNQSDISDLARFIHLISRIFVAYFVYQTIQAFRKLGKSGG